MKKVNFSDVFSVEYMEIITKYKSHIQKLLSMYDIVIFMARKAICFYKAMVVNGEIIPNEKCMVLSSRILSYNVIKKFKGKRIAIIDDVVVKGKSISYSKKIFEEEGIDVDVHFVACEKEFIEAASFKNSIKSPYIYLSDTNICQLSNYITEYIEASMIPYNVDQPIYSIEFENFDEYNRVFLSRNCISNISDGLQKKNKIQNVLIHFNPTILKNIFGNDFDTENTYLKIRFMHRSDSLKLIAIPFVLLPEISYEKLDEVFGRLFKDKFDNYTICHNQMEEHENKLKILQYILSDILFCAYSEVFKSNSIVKNMENEIMQFAVELVEKSFVMDLCHYFSDWSYDEQIKGFESRFMLDRYLADAYDYIFDLSISNSNYFDMRGNIQEQRIITIWDLISYIKKREGELFEKYAISSIIDILIDKGILVPSIVHGEKGSIIRGYKCGEIYNLTQKGIELFAYMLDQYAEIKQGIPIYKIELEKLCVLFFKNAAYRNRLFSISKTFDDDCFSICYSKFGPRVSRCSKKYKVESKSALATVLEERGNIYLDKEKYKINASSVPKNNKWKIIADNFALSYYHLYLCFEEKIVRNQYVHTYNDFLTLLAIGSGQKNQMFSLIAELFLMTRIEISSSLSEILDEMDKYSYRKKPSDKQQYQGIMDGIGSGLWKYSCFCLDGLMDSIFIAAAKKQSDIRFIKEEYLTDTDENDENPIFAELIDECGYLLYEIAYLFNYAQKKLKKTGTDMNKIFRKSAFYNKKFKIMRNAIKVNCEKWSDEELINNFNELQKRALALVNKCDLCIEEAAFNLVMTHNNVCVIFPHQFDLVRIGNEINLNSHIENDLIGKCVFSRYDTKKDFEQQLTELMNIYKITKKNVSLIFINTEHSYEGIFEGYHSATGDYFKKLVKKILIRDDYHTDISTNKVIFCTRQHIDNVDIHFKKISLKYVCCGEVFDGYNYVQYILMEESEKEMEKDSHDNVTNFNGPITINGIVGAIGGKSTVYQNVNEKVNMEEFFKEVKEMNLGVAGDDSNVIALVKEIKEEAANKNQEGVLSKLKKLAINVGSGVFSGMVSTIIVEMMKMKGYFPF